MMQHECQVCGKPAGITCPGCNAMFYCSEKHLRRHVQLLGHADECARMAEQLTRRKVTMFSAQAVDAKALCTILSLLMDSVAT